MQEGQLSEMQARFEEAQRSIHEMTSARSRMSTESEEISRQLEEAESQVGQLSKVRQIP